MGKRYQDNKDRKKITNVNIETDTKRKKKKKKGRLLKKIILFLFVLFVLGAFAVNGMIFGVLNGAERLNRSDLTYSNLTTFIYDKDGNEYATLYGTENRILIGLDEMSPYLPTAFKAIEDERFETHFGVDIQRTLYAIFTYVKNGGKSSFGGSTITQQLVKNLTQDKEDDPLRKVREWVRAVQVESWLSKDDIMEMYLNMIYLGEGAYGVQAASYAYFGKGANELTLAECAVLAGINHGPELYDQYKAPEKIKKRQEVVLNKLLELEWISKEEYEEAIAQELVYESVSVNQSSSYIVEAVINQVVKDIVEEKKVTRAVANKMIYGDGLKIYTNIDPKIQSYIEEIYADESYFPLDKTYNERPQSAMVIIDYRTGAIVGLVGGSGDKVLRGLNRAIQSTRQPGSTIKPIAVYGPGIDRKVITASTVYDDVPFSLPKWNVTNWTGGYAGLSTIRKAIEKSMNIVAVKTLQDLGVSTSYTYLQKMGITSLVEGDKQLPLALGGISRGISPLQMCGAYATIANNGVYIEPQLYKKVTDSKGVIILEDEQDQRNVFSEGTAFIVRNMMQDVITGTNGTAKYVNIGGSAVAGKTGSTDSNYDRWFCAITPYYVGTTWFGFDEQKRVRISGQNPAVKIWNAVMKKVHADLEVKSFEKAPDSIQTATICVDSGKLATDLCAIDPRGTRVRSEYYLSGTVPTDYCTTHVSKSICTQTNLLAGSDCPADACVDKIFIQRDVLLNGVENAADYIYEAPRGYCTVHEYIPTNPDVDPNDPPVVEPQPEPETDPDEPISPGPGGII